MKLHTSPSFMGVLRSTQGGNDITNYAQQAFQENPMPDFYPTLWFRINSLSLLTEIFVGWTCFVIVK